MRRHTRPTTIRIPTHGGYVKRLGCPGASSPQQSYRSQSLAFGCGAPACHRHACIVVSIRDHAFPRHCRRPTRVTNRADATPAFSAPVLSIPMGLQSAWPDALRLLRHCLLPRPIDAATLAEHTVPAPQQCRQNGRLLLKVVTLTSRIFFLRAEIPGDWREIDFKTSRRTPTRARSRASGDRARMNEDSTWQEARSLGSIDIERAVLHDEPDDQLHAPYRVTPIGDQRL